MLVRIAGLEAREFILELLKAHLVFAFPARSGWARRRDLRRRYALLNSNFIFKCCQRNPRTAQALLLLCQLLIQPLQNSQIRIQLLGQLAHILFTKTFKYLFLALKAYTHGL